MLSSPRVVLLAALALLVVPAAARAAAPYSSKALKFSATFPSAPREQVEGEGSGTAAWVDPAAGLMYMVGVTPSRPEISKNKSIKEQLDDGLSGALEKVHGKLESQKDIKLGKYPGREVEIGLTGGHATFRAYIVATRVYMVGVVHKDGATLPMTAQDFFASFKLSR